MTAIADLLDQVRSACKLNSDNELANAIGLKRQTIHQWRHSLAPVSDERIAQLCAMAKLDGPEWLARIHAERAQSPAERALWTKMLTRLAAAAIFIAPLSAFGNEKTPEIKGFSGDSAASVYYVKLRALLARFLPRLTLRLKRSKILTGGLRYA